MQDLTLGPNVIIYFLNQAIRYENVHHMHYHFEYAITIWCGIVLTSSKNCFFFLLRIFQSDRIMNFIINSCIIFEEDVVQENK